MNKLFRIFAALAIVCGFTACEEPAPAPTPSDEHKVILTADHTTIFADGVETATFTVTVDGVERTAECSIINLADNSIVEPKSFSTTEAGVYRFAAIYGKNSSEPLLITAKAIENQPEEITSIELQADKLTILADGNDTVTFTVISGKLNLTSKSTIVYAINDEPISGNTFSTDEVGSYTFKARYGELESPEITITATNNGQPEEKRLTLYVSSNRIKADGSDTTTFTVTYGDEDVTTASSILDTDLDLALNGYTFTTTTAATYNFQAKYDGKESNVVSVVAYEPVAPGAYNVGDLYDEGGVKGVVFAIEEMSGKTWCYIMSMDQTALAWSTENTWCNCINQRGDWNTDDMLRFGSDPSKYPAAQWCQAHGEGWFMPSETELKWMWRAVSGGKYVFNEAEAAKFNNKLDDPVEEDFYWSSNETAEDLATTVAFMDDSVVCLEPLKYKAYCVRAVYRFEVE